MGMATLANRSPSAHARLCGRYRFDNGQRRSDSSNMFTPSDLFARRASIAAVCDLQDSCD